MRARAETPTGSFTCVCGEGFPTEMALDGHTRDMHQALRADKTETFVCPECGSTFGSYDQLREHHPAHS